VVVRIQLCPLIGICTTRQATADNAR